MTHWMTSGDELVPREVAQAVVQLEEIVNKVLLFMAMVVISFQREATLIDTAHCTAILRNEVSLAKAASHSELACLRRLPMHRPLAFYKQYFDNLEMFAKGVSDCVFERVCEEVLASSKAMDAACPRWGEYIDAEGVHLELARLQLVQNVVVSRELPKRLRELSASAAKAQAMADIFGLPPLKEYAPSREPVHAAENSLGFGTRTVQVAAGVKVLMLPQEEMQHHVPKLDPFKHNLPGGLVKAIMDKSSGETPGTGAAKKTPGRSDRGPARATAQAAPSAKRSAPRRRRPQGGHLRSFSARSTRDEVTKREATPSCAGRGNGTMTHERCLQHPSNFGLGVGSEAFGDARMLAAGTLVAIAAYHANRRSSSVGELCVIVAFRRRGLVNACTTMFAKRTPIRCCRPCNA